ncbi:hypothetical protein [Diaphorobacter nitroreducens]
MPSTLVTTDQHSAEVRPLAVFFLLLALIYGSWLLVFWPGVLGEDSLGILLEVMNPETRRSGKPVFWYYFVRIFYLPHQLAEVPIAAMLLISAFILSRILAWCWAQRFYKTALFLLLFICLTPHLIFFAGMLYPDGIFSIAVAGLLFEVWLLAQRRQASALSLAIIAVSLPFAVFARANGIIFLLPLVVLIPLLERRGRWWIGCILAGWCALIAVGAKAHKSEGHDVLYPLAIFETVNFLQPRPMNLWVASPRVSPLTVETLTKYKPIDLYVSHYDPDYWDTLVFRSEGPQVMSITKQDRKVITKEFLRYNMWHNMPKFLGSRLNVFLVSAFAQGGPLGFGYAEHVLQVVKSNSVYRQFQWPGAEATLREFQDFSYKHRWLFWTPFLGIGLLAWALRRGVLCRDTALLLVSIPMLVQLVAIFVFSIAGEYRYILPLFTLPLVLLPALALARQAAAPQSASV